MGYSRRRASESTTLEQAISVIGFVGSTTTTVREGVVYGWHNHVDRERLLCGATDYLAGNTRVRSLP